MLSSFRNSGLCIWICEICCSMVVRCRSAIIPLVIPRVITAPHNPTAIAMMIARLRFLLRHTLREEMMVIVFMISSLYIYDFEGVWFADGAESYPESDDQHHQCL